ncbi:MAG: choice-of-anchor J domain-containing protein, partial [Anaerolineae bacterium]
GIGGGAYVYDLTYAPGSSTTAYAGSWGVWRTTDGGSNWAALGNLGHWVRDVDALGGLHPDLFAGTNDAGVSMSPDADGTWTAINTGLGDYRVRSLKAVDANHLFAGTNGSSAWDYTVVSRPLDAVGVDEPEGTDTWTQKGPYIWAPGVIQIAIDPVTSSIIYAATDQGVYKSTNGGESWVPKNQGLGGYGDLVISGISIDPSNVNTIYLGTWGYGVFKSTNGGNTWTRLADPLKCSKVYLPNVMRNYATSSEETILSETFEGTFPGEWIVGDDNSDDGYYFWGKRNCRSYGGSYSGWAAGAGDSYLSCGSDYRDNMSSWMIYGPFSLAGASGAELTFKLWLNSEQDFDFLCRYASTDGSSFSGSCTHGYSAGWIDRTLDLSGYAGQPNVWIALRFVSDDSVTYPEGAHVDNIEVRKWSGSRDMTAVDVPAVVPDTLYEEPATWSIP